MSIRTTSEDIAIGNEGERMFIANLWSYWAHLSIYRFALPFAIGRRVLDVGTGTGYGTAYLARHGASGVLGFDVSNDAVAYARHRFAGDPVTYEVADLNDPLPVGDAVFDLVFSSNVFEHVGNIDGLVAECARVVRPEGAVMIAVPPILSAQALADDIRSPFHVHHIPPTAWHAKLSRFFSTVHCHKHIGAGIWSDDARMLAESTAPAEQVTIRETDFAFPEVTIDELNTPPGITAIFVCRMPRAEPGPETLAERTPAAWREGTAAAQAIAELRAALAAARRTHAMPAPSPGTGESAAAWPLEAGEEHEIMWLRAHLAAARARVTAIEASTSWRLMAPVRRLVEAFRRQKGAMRSGATVFPL